MTAKGREDRDAYPLAPEEPIGVSAASACTTALTPEKRAAVKSYLSSLGPALRGKYGRRPHYSPAQVRETALERALSIDYLCWAYLLHCSAPDFGRIHAAAGDVCDYAGMRLAVGEAFFGGNADFVTAELTEALVTGAAGAATSGAEAAGWLGAVDWTGLLNWS